MLYQLNDWYGGWEIEVNLVKISVMFSRQQIPHLGNIHPHYHKSRK